MWSNATFDSSSDINLPVLYLPTFPLYLFTPSALWCSMSWLSGIRSLFSVIFRWKSLPNALKCTYIGSEWCKLFRAYGLLLAFSSTVNGCTTSYTGTEDISECIRLVCRMGAIHTHSHVNLSHMEIFIWLMKKTECQSFLIIALQSTPSWSITQSTVCLKP